MTRHRREAYSCEALAWDPGSARTWLLGSGRADTPRMALRWLTGQAVRIARALDPEPGGAFPTCALREIHPSFPTPGSTLRAWAHDMWAHGEHMELLKRGVPVRISTVGPDRIMGAGELDVCYVLSGRVVDSGRNDGS